MRHTEDLYAGIDPTALPAQSQTAYKWSFASSRSKAERQALEATRSEISALTNNGSNGASSARIQGPSLPGRSIGPTLPSSSDLTLARELQEEAAWEEKSLKRKRDKRGGEGEGRGCEWAERGGEGEVDGEETGEEGGR